MDGLTSKEHWKSILKNYEPRRTGKDCRFFDLFRRHLPPGSELKCLEVGCTPGRFLVAFNRNFGYSVHGVDQLQAELTEKNLEFNGIRDHKIYESDFLEWETREKFDVISSFGYLEHFRNPRLHIEKMVSLMRSGSYLIIEIPNLRYLNYLMRSVLRKDSDWKKIHNLEIINPDFFSRIGDEFGLETVYLGHYMLFSYWHKGSGPMAIASAPLRAASFVLCKITDALNLNTALANRYTSPFIVYIAKKK